MNQLNLDSATKAQELGVDKDLSAKNLSGRTWVEQEQIFRADNPDLAPDILKRKLEAHYRFFVLYTMSNPAAELRQQLFEEAYEARGGLERERLGFVEVAKRTWI